MIHRFGAFELDEAAQELRRAGKLVRVQRQPFRVLLALVSRPGEVVTREELRALLWGQSLHVEFEQGLNFAVSRVREALGDSARAPRFVETVQRCGYRFVAPVDVVGVERSRPSLTAKRTEHGFVTPHPPPDSATGAEAPLAASNLTAGMPPRSRTGLMARVAVAAVFTLAALASRAGRIPPTAAELAAVDPATHALYAEATQLCGAEGWRRSIRLYRQVRDRAPSFAPALVGIARSYVALAEHGLLLPDQAFPTARSAALEALSLEESAEARVLLATVLLEFDWRPEEASRELARAVELAPTSASAWARMARCRSLAGDDEGALEAARRAEALDPGDDDVVVELAECLYRAGLLEESARAWRLVASRRAIASHHALFLVHRERGRHAEALAEAREVMRAADVPPEAVDATMRAGDERGARLYLSGSIAALSRRADRELVAPERLALLHAAIGETEQALARLEEAAAMRSPAFLAALRDPLLNSLRDTPRFRALEASVASGAPFDSGPSRPAWRPGNVTPL